MKKYTFFRSAGLLLAVFLTVQACKDGPAATGEASSFDLLQDRILTPSCATSGCHASEQDGTYNAHRLVLTSGKSYANLIGITPVNTLSKGDGHLRVRPFKSLESLLFHKLNFDVAHHGGKVYGNPMPLGKDPLSVGQIEFVRRWIESGAPATGTVADAKLLDDDTPSYVENFTPLAAPSPSEGFQLAIEKFEVAPNFERELFIRKALNNTEEVYINRMQLKGRRNSHHLVVYDFRDKTFLPALNQIRDLRNPDNSLNALTLFQMQNHIFMGGGSEANSDYTLPEGTAIYLPPNASVDINPHYFNKTSRVLYGENYVNLYKIDKSKVSKVVKMLDLGNQELSIPANSRVTINKSWVFNDKPRRIVMLTSHTHKFGEKFVIRIKNGPRDGQIIYETTDWEHPLRKDFSPTVRLEKGEGLTSEITYNNTSSKAIRFGLTSDDEMGIIFGYYYED